MAVVGLVFIVTAVFGLENENSLSWRPELFRSVNIQPYIIVLAVAHITGLLWFTSPASPGPLSSLSFPYVA